MRITIDQDRCVGAGQCVLVGPDLFDQRDEDGVAFVLTDGPEGAAGGPGEEHRAAAEEAARVCPAAAITVAGTER
ncbi:MULTISPECIES: ferredoxin [Streptomyces]|uniref:Ferredoxin n=1 Tax=Streptomyces cacaoi TaxID=1898 RepID=A0A4Y3QXK5_STRCI|nr:MULTISPECIES: ferredoxin [Streptomyces]NNG87981.1 ferredoxin [Streptomyces cacaoi]QHF93110.1 ferredoxin [Streptomyces sp. NHF165]GEB49323.1 ferredoxin [Streptomyces cacaoi]